MVLSGLIFLVTIYLFIAIPKGFIPNDDLQLTATTEVAQGISFTEMIKHQEQIADIVRKNPNKDVQFQVFKKSKKKFPFFVANDNVMIILTKKNYVGYISLHILDKSAPRL
jgi:multidrug efflux pump subunit AcrB